MNDGSWRDVWLALFRDGLTCVRDAVWARDNAPPEQERRALTAVAKHAAFGGPDLPGAPVARGQTLLADISAAVAALLPELPPTAATSAGRPEDKAILLWARALQKGLNPAQLARLSPDLFPATGKALEMRIRATMWLRGNRPLEQAAPGIERIVDSSRVTAQR